jgi:anti-repressor protein
MMINELQEFKYTERHAIRTTNINGDVWFVAKDVCDILELADVTSALRSLDDDEKMTLQNQRSHSGQRGGAQFMSMVNEPGLYKLIFKSRKPEAKQFTRWVTHEVLPSIRKSGMYLTDEAAEAYMNNPEVFKALVKRCSTLEAKVKEMEATLTERYSLSVLG